MHWLIKCRSKPATDALRLATIAAHRDFLDGYPEVTWYSGPLFTDDNKNAIGSLRLIEFPDRDAALAYINADPYTKAGIFETITVERWKPGLEVRQRDYPRRDGTMQFVIPRSTVQIVIEPSGVVAGKLVAVEIVIAGSAEYDIAPRPPLDQIVPLATVEKIVPAADRDRHVIAE